MSEIDKEKGPRGVLILSGLVTFLGLFSLFLGSRLVPQLILLVVLAFLITNKRYLWLDIIFKTLHRDLTAVKRFSKVLLNMWLWERNNETVPKLFRRTCEKHPDKVAFHFENEAWTFRQVDEYSNRVGNLFKFEGYKKGDVVALFMENRIEFVAIWLGLSKLGVVTALINSNLRDKPLVHSITAAQSKAMIYASDLKQGVVDVISEIKDVKLYEFNKMYETDGLKAIDFDKKLSTSPTTSLNKETEQATSKDKLLFIYTSGTTGMPKAAVINNTRFLLMSYGVHSMLNIQDDDILYDPLPLYHTSGGIIGIGQSLLTGNTVVIRKKFSASNFWPDCIKYECTVATYIGEICRYVLSVPEKPHDTEHKVRLIYGNGLRPQIWRRFMERFQIKEVREFYGATEGNSNLVNIDGRVGAVGFVPRIAHALYPVTLVKVNQETEEPIRNSQGFCIRCQPGEPGMFIGKINPNKAINSFTGYADKKASERKILRDVFTKGDRYFNSGDILVMDEYGYFYFKDRTGDTFRWRGENVATSEVEAVVSNIVGLKDAIVYGVEVPHVEGRAGMVAIMDPENAINLKQLDDGLKKMLPVYARPLFVRILNKLPMTGTYKLKKKDLQVEGYDPNQVKDKLYFYDARSKQFQIITPELFKDIENGKVNL